MKKVVLGLILVLPSAMLGASPEKASSADVDLRTGQPAHAAAAVHHGRSWKNISGSIGAAGIFSRQYSLSPSSGGQYGAEGTVQKLAGWSATAEANLHKHIGMQVDFLSLYNTNSNPRMSKFAVLAGPRYTFKSYWKVVPFAFAEAGETRTTYGQQNPSNHPGSDWNPTANGGIGFDLKLSRNFAIQAVPAEWMGERFDYSGHWQNSYQARMGFVFYLRK